MARSTFDTQAPCSVEQMGPKTRWIDSSELTTSSIHRRLSPVPSTKELSETFLEAVWSGWTPQTHGPAIAEMCRFPDVLGWHYVGPTYAAVGHGRRWNGYVATISAEFREELVLMDENSGPHRAHLVNKFLLDNNIARLEWPACSPDKTPIDHSWDTLKRAVFGRNDPPNTLRDLRRIAVEEWDNLDQQDLHELVDSMPRRIQACINARGHATGY